MCSTVVLLDLLGRPIGTSSSPSCRGSHSDWPQRHPAGIRKSRSFVSMCFIYQLQNLQLRRASAKHGFYMFYCFIALTWDLFDEIPRLFDFTGTPVFSLVPWWSVSTKLEVYQECWSLTWESVLRFLCPPLWVPPSVYGQEFSRTQLHLKSTNSLHLVTSSIALPSIWLLQELTTADYVWRSSVPSSAGRRFFTQVQSLRQSLRIPKASCGWSEAPPKTSETRINKQISVAPQTWPKENHTVDCRPFNFIKNVQLLFLLVFASSLFPFKVVASHPVTSTEACVALQRKLSPLPGTGVPNTVSWESRLDWKPLWKIIAVLDNYKQGKF